MQWRKTNDFKVRRQSKWITMSHWALAYHKDDNDLFLARKNSVKAVVQRHRQRPVGKAI